MRALRWRHLGRWAVAAVSLIPLLALAACRPATPALTPVTVQLRWTHQAQFAGLYAADKLGYYAAEGLAVRLVEGGPGADVLGPLVAGTSQFAVVGADTLLLARADGLPVRAIGSVYQRSPIVLIAMADSGIAKAQDVVGKTVRVTPDTAPAIHAMMARAGVAPDHYVEVNVPSDLEQFASGQVPVWAAFIDGFALTAERAGYRLNYIYPDDYGVHFYGDVLAVTDELARSNPDLVERFLRATLKGWTYAVENVAEVGPLVATYAAGADPALESAKMATSLPLINTGEDFIGWMKPAQWESMEHTLREQGIITRPLDVRQAYTLEYVEAIYTP